jgi:hypothetical protein
MGRIGNPYIQRAHGEPDPDHDEWPFRVRYAPRLPAVEWTLYPAANFEAAQDEDREERITLLREQDQEAFEFLTVDGAVIDD